MVRIKYNKEFKKHLKIRILPNRNLFTKYKERLKLFEKDRTNPILSDHKLRGKLEGFRTFNITGNIRVVYFGRGENYYVFLDIGTHPQIYGM
ncbi:MAG: plasmid stabilization system protein [Microgenomates group bacterium GW2011_GWC1_37_8]|nr:MAG: plasmid stabilization system protein [Microgenomates group bacterium GW2011_GWC1_37_8]